MAAGPAFALSCQKPDPVRAYLLAAEAEASYVVLLGRFDFTPSPEPRRPVGNPNQQVPAPPVVAQFTGRSLAAAGFNRAFSGPVTLVPVCMGPWCGRFPPAGEMLAFVEVADEGHRLDLDPCMGTVFASPTPEDIARVEACHRGEVCEMGAER